MYSAKAPWNMTPAEIAADIETCRREIAACERALSDPTTRRRSLYATHASRCRVRIGNLEAYA